MTIKRIFVAVALFVSGIFYAEAENSYILDNGKVHACFAGGDTFRIEELIMNGKTVATAGSSTFWHISCLGPLGETPTWRPKHGKYQGAVKSREGNVSRLTFSWNLRYDYSGKYYPVRAIISLPDDADRLFFELEADLPEGWIVTSTDYPEISCVLPENGKLITTSGWGVEEPLTPVKVSVAYPTVTSAMQFILVHDKDGALYFGTEDSSGSGRYYNVDGNRALHVSMTVPASEAWTSDGTFRLPFAANIGFDVKGWEHAVNTWYKPATYNFTWGGEERKIVNRLETLSPWLLDTDGWVRLKTVEDEFAALDKAADIFGPHLSAHWYWWHQIDYDTHYPDYLPARDGFAERIAQIHKKGVQITPYINGRLWDPKSDSYLRDGGINASARKMDGTLYTEIYSTSGVVNTVTCPYTKTWHDKLCGLVDSLQRKFNVDGVYIDQIGCTIQTPCWNPDHGHPRGGGEFYLEGYRNILRDIRSNILRPEGMLSTEENGECYSDLFDMMLMVNSRYRSGYSKIIPVFPMVYSDRIITSAYTYLPEILEVGQPSTYRFAFAKALLYGSQPGWVRAFIITDPKFENEAIFLKNLMDFRKGIHDIVVGGSFVREFAPRGDNPECTYVRFWKDSAVLGAEWIDRNGGKAMILVNTDTKSHKVTLPAGVPQKKVTVPALDAVVIRY